METSQHITKKPSGKEYPCAWLFFQYYSLFELILLKLIANGVLNQGSKLKFVEMIIDYRGYVSGKMNVSVVTDINRQTCPDSDLVMVVFVKICIC